MDKYNPIPCGGFGFDPETIKFVEKDGKPVMTVIKAEQEIPDLW